jgi:uncharacterized protein (DUF305 family)
MNQTIPTPRRLRSVGILLSCALLTSAFAADPAPEEAQARFEVDFLTDMITHHEGAVAMAELVAERTERPELEEMAAMMATAQQEEIETMQGWLEEWYGETVDEAPELDRKTQRQVDALSELEGEEFEEAFLKAMSLHHADGIMAMNGALLRAYHSEILDLVRAMIATQADEIVLMRGWLMEWHEVNEVTPRDRPDNRRWEQRGRTIPAGNGRG